MVGGFKRVMRSKRITLDGLTKFLKSWKELEIRQDALFSLVEILQESLRKNVFTNRDDTYEIPTKAEMLRYIRSKTKPSRPVPYSKEYLNRKDVGDIPHRYKEDAFYSGTEVYKDAGRVIMKVEPLETSEKSSDYLEIHEKTRSVVKYAFVSSWQEIVDDILDTYGAWLNG